MLLLTQPPSGQATPQATLKRIMLKKVELAKDSMGFHNNVSGLVEIVENHSFVCYYCLIILGEMCIYINIHDFKTVLVPC